MAARLGRAGYSECYDDLERIARNYLRWVQFFVTPEYEALLRQRNGEKAEALRAEVERLQGGFIGSPEVNDLYNSAPPCGGCAGHQGIDMMGCCPPEGVRALWETWSNTVRQEKEGLFVNMSFNCVTPEVRVISFAPEQGRLTAVAQRNAGAMHLRPPSWTVRGMVKSYRNAKETPAQWLGDYVVFGNVKAGEEVTITYPLIGLKQKLTIAKGFGGKEKTFVQSWVGNTIVDIEPRGRKLPIFSGPAPVLPAVPR
jgi:hypothetical protein